MDEFLLKVYEEAKTPSSNLSIVLQPYFRTFYRRCPSSDIYRQRTYLIIVFVETLQSPPWNLGQEKISRIIKTHLDVCNYMKRYYDEKYWKLPLEKELDKKLIRASLNTLCNISPKKHVDIIQTLYCLNDSSNGLLSYLCDQLQNLIETSPLTVLAWIEAFELHSFKTDHMRNLLMSCLVHNIDISKYLMNTDASKNKSLSILDSFVDKKPAQMNHLERKLFDKFSPNNLSSMAYKHARPNKYDRIPNTMKQRTVKNFIHNSSNITGNEYKLLALQTVEASKNSLEQVKEVLRFIAKRNVILAIALGHIIKLSHNNMDLVFVQFHYLKEPEKQDVQEEIKKVLQLQTAPDFPRIGSIDCENFQCILVDDEDSLTLVLQALCATENRLVAFDVEASYVCQSSISIQEAVLLQIATTDDTVYLVDIYTLKTVLTIFDWEVFFEVFFRSRIRRVGFGIKNDLNFLQCAFPFLKDFFEKKKPRFFCVQDAVKTLANNSETLDSVFNDIPPQNSLQYVTKTFVGVSLAKDEQSSNWCARPLKEEKMIYAAQDAYYTLKSYKELQRRLNKEQWFGLKKVILHEPEPMPTQPSNAAFSLSNKKKESFEEIVEHLKKVCEEIKDNASRKAEDVLIILDAPFLKFVPTLRRCGFATWDHRDASPNSSKSSKQMEREMETFLNGLEKSIRSNTFILSHKKTLSVFLSPFESFIITATQEQCETIVTEKIIRKAQAIVDFANIHKRCAICRMQDSHAIIPTLAYRLLFKSFATYKGFDQKVSGLEHTIENFVEAFKLLPPEEKENCSIDGDELLLKTDANTFRFSITGRDVNLWVGEEKTVFPGDTRLFENKTQRTEVKFCCTCKIFF